MDDTHSMPAARFRTAPPAGPSFPALVAIHFRLGVRDVRLGSAVLAVVAGGLPIAVLLAPPVPGEASELGSSPWAALNAALLFLTMFAVLDAFLEPESVWRKLRPGEREPLDALPVGRRQSRLARVVAGAALPLVLVGSVFGTVALMEARGFSVRPEGDVFQPALPMLAEDPGTAGILAAILTLLSAYVIGSICALWFGRVFYPLLLMALGFVGGPVILMAFGIDWLSAVAELAATHAYSPLRVLSLWFGAAADLLPAAFWFTALGALLVYVAGRHDRG